MAPTIRPRSDWGPRYANGAGPAPLPATEGVFLHHSDGRAVNGPARVRDLEDIGQAKFKAGISYTFVVSPDGTIWEGHSIDRRGSHTKNYNSKGRAIVLVGNYETATPTAAQQESAAQLVAHGVRQGWWPTTRVRPHRAVRQTACPGNGAVAIIPTITARADALLAGAPTQTPGGLTMADVDTILARLDDVEGKVDRLLTDAKTRTAWDGELRKAVAATLDAVRKGELEDARQHAQVIEGLMLHEAAAAERDGA
jgi:hypothetical protein